MPDSREDSQPDARLRILDAAIAAIDANGEASIRVVDIAATAGVAPGLINHHFGGREGLVAKAQERRFVRDLGPGFAGLLTVLSESGSRETIIEGARQRLMATARRDLAPNRLSRITALSSAHGRPDLRAELSEVVGGSIDGAADAIGIGQEMGVFRADVDARAAATVFMSLGLGLVLADFDARPEPEENIAALVGLLFDLMVAPDPAIAVDGDAVGESDETLGSNRRP